MVAMFFAHLAKELSESRYPLLRILLDLMAYVVVIDADACIMINHFIRV